MSNNGISFFAGISTSPYSKGIRTQKEILLLGISYPMISGDLHRYVQMESIFCPIIVFLFPKNSIFLDTDSM